MNAKQKCPKKSRLLRWSKRGAPALSGILLTPAELAARLAVGENRGYARGGANGRAFATAIRCLLREAGEVRAVFLAGCRSLAAT